MENAGYSFNGGSIAGSSAIYEPVSPQIAGGRRKRTSVRKAKGQSRSSVRSHC